MKLSEWWSIIFAVQGLAIFFDEFYFHHKRGLPLWERIGHPLDTLSVLVPMPFTLFVAPSSTPIGIFIALSIFSCLLITKDEFVHKEVCTGAENWLHAVLFIVHPLSLILVGLIWVNPSVNLSRAVLAQSVLVGVFLIYQIVYWSFIWKKSTTTSTKNSVTAGTPPTTIRLRS